MRQDNLIKTLLIIAALLVIAIAAINRELPADNVGDCEPVATTAQETND